MGRASKAKGSGFEREVCRVLSLHVTGGGRDDLFWRSAMSGGRATRAHRKGKTLAHVAGDICAVDAAGEEFIKQFYVECKFYRDLNLTSFFVARKGLLWGFWLRAVVEAARYKKYPLLIAKQNLVPTLAITTAAGSEGLGLSSRSVLALSGRRGEDFIVHDFVVAFSTAATRPSLRRKA